MKRESIKLLPSDWAALAVIADQTGSVYSGVPSWRRLVKRIARGELSVVSEGVKVVRMHPASNGAVSHRLVSRNAPCPCGSGSKFKHCCLK